MSPLRRVFTLALTFLIAASLTASAGEIRIGSCNFRFDNVFMLRVINAMSSEAEKLGVKLENVDGQNNQSVQNGQADRFIADGVSALIMNPVDRMASQPIIDKAKAAGIPVVFIKREPTPEMLASYSRLQFVLLKGEYGHQDTLPRSEYSVRAVRDAGIEPVEVASAIANWDKQQAMKIMNGFITSIGLENIEAVIANNDEMALGAVEALKACGYNKGDPALYVPVVGIDGNASALEAMDRGELLGTVFNDAENQGIAAVRLAAALAEGRDIDAIGCAVTDNKYIWIPYQKVTRGEK